MERVTRKKKLLYPKKEKKPVDVNNALEATGHSQGLSLGLIGTGAGRRLREK